MKQHPIYKAALASAGVATVADINLVDTAKLIRSTLKARFPGIKFSVRTSRYAGGSSIDVGWIDGPLESAVREVIAPYAGCGFDGMNDYQYMKGGWLCPDGSAEYRFSEGGERCGGSTPTYDRPASTREAIPVSFGVSYVHSSRRKSVEYLATVMRAYAERHENDLATAIKSGAVYAAGEPGYAYMRGADHIMVDGVGWADVAIHRFEYERAAGGSA